MRISLVPMIIFVVLAVIFAWRLVLVNQGEVPNLIPSTMIGRVAPVFDMPVLRKNGAQFFTADLRGKVHFINFFASWCVACRQEHSLLLQLTGQGAVLVGIDYKDAGQDAVQWLVQMGDPYDVIAVDRRGRVGIDFGVYGVPESYVVDRQGVIRFKQTGPLTVEDVQTKILPLIKELNK
ncbi:MAG: DsbE family thiol:disulfide interchange protein [Proteobacteria bacterium]|nr:DsbE family thiol:disulfide interchange protein [Pseudomonadota bacterium]